MRRTTVLLISVFLMQFGAGVGTTGVPLMAKYRFDASLWTLAVIGAMGSLTYALACVGLGAVVGKIRPFTVALLGIFICAAAYTGATSATASWQMVFVVMGGGVGFALYWPMVEAEIAAGAAGQRLNRRIGFFNITWSLADAGGTALSGYLYSINPALPFIALVIVMLGVAGAVLAARRMPIDGEEPLPKRFGREMTGGATSRETNARWRKGAWVGNFVGSGVIQVVRSVLPAPAKAVFHMSPAVVGLVLATYNVFRTLTFVALREWPDWHYRPRIFLAFNSLMAAGMVLAVAAGFMPGAAATALVFVAFAASGVGLGMTYYSSIFYAVDTEEAAASTTRLHEAVLGAGGALAVLMSGVVDKAAAAAGAISALGGLPLMSAPTNQLLPFAMSAAAVALGMTVSASQIRATPRNMLEVPAGGEYSGGAPGA